MVPVSMTPDLDFKVSVSFKIKYVKNGAR